MIRTYFDTVITSGRARRDLRPQAEMDAVDRLDAFHAEGRIKIVTSKLSWIEQGRTPDPEPRSALIAGTDDVSMVQADHRLLGFQSID